jgi:hypothetical protein
MEIIKTPEQPVNENVEQEMSNAERALEARRNGNEELAIFYEKAKDGVDAPAHPGVLLKMLELFYRNRATIIDSRSHPEAVVRDTREMLNEWTRVSHPELLDMDDNQVDQALFTYFDIKA